MVVQAIHVIVILDTLEVSVKHVTTVTVRIVILEELVKMVEKLIPVIVNLVTLENIASMTAAIIRSDSMNQLVKWYRDHQSILVLSHRLHRTFV